MLRFPSSRIPSKSANIPYLYMFSPPPPPPPPPQKFYTSSSLVPPDLDFLLLPLQKILVGTNMVCPLKCKDYSANTGNFLSYIILSKICIKHGKVQAKICCQEFVRSLRSARIKQDILLEFKKKQNALRRYLHCCTCLTDTSFPINLPQPGK